MMLSRDLGSAAKRARLGTRWLTDASVSIANGSAFRQETPCFISDLSPSLLDYRQNSMLLLKGQISIRVAHSQ